MPLQNILTDPDRRSLIPRLFVTLHEDDSLDTKYESVNPNGKSSYSISYIVVSNR